MPLVRTPTGHVVMLPDPVAPMATAAMSPVVLAADMARRVINAPAPYTTQLHPTQEAQFQDWVRANKVPFDPSAMASDYDMRGFYQALQAGRPEAVTAVNQGDGLMHYPDTWKTPLHATFSNESIYATPDAPAWVGDKLIAKDGRVIADETPKGKR